MNAHDEMLDNVAVYALGALPPEQARDVRLHLETCAECRAEYAELAPAVQGLAVSAEACPDTKSAVASVAPPSPLLKKRIMRQIRPNVGEMRAVRPIVWPAYAVAAACLLIAIITGVGEISRSVQLQSEQARNVTLAHANAQLLRLVADQKTQLADLVNPNSQHYPVTYGQVVKHGSRLYIAMDTLPPPPKGKVYQAWTLRGGARDMSPSITFVPAENGLEVQQIPVNAKDVVAVALSVEPAGGSKQPTSAPVFVVKLT